MAIEQTDRAEWPGPAGESVQILALGAPEVLRGLGTDPINCA